MTKTELLSKCARDGEERILLARALDQMDLAQQRGAPTNTGFLSPGEQSAVTSLLASCGHPRHLFFGGFDGAERAICVFLPDWQEPEDFLADPEGPLTALEGLFATDAVLSHRDLLGSLIGIGITREKIGDIIVDENRAQVVVIRSALPILLSQWESAGRWKVRLKEIPLDELAPKAPELKIIRDSVATLRLDCIVGAGFSLARTKASDLVSGGRVSINHRECAKSDKPVAQGDVISCRGLGKCVVAQVVGQSKKGRTMVELHRYI